MLDLDCELQSKLDFAKTGHPKVAALMALEVLFVDEVSMIDVDCWATVSKLFAVVSQSKRPGTHSADEFGDVHVILFGD